MKLHAIERSGVTVISPEGNILGGPEASALNDELHKLIDQGKDKVVIDLSNVSLMNSSGLGLLIGAFTTMKNAGGMLKLAGANDKVQGLIEISKLTSIFPSHHTVDDAVSSLL